MRLVRFRPGHLELNPLDQAPKELGQELMRKLKAWTGRVWIVALSGEEGAAPLGQQRREREAKEIEAIRTIPRSSRSWISSRAPASPRCGRLTRARTPADNDEPAENEFKEDGTDP